jgi:hypothetical protein
MLAKAIRSGLLINANYLSTDINGNLHGSIDFCVNNSTKSLLRKELVAFFGKDILSYANDKKINDTYMISITIPKPVQTVSESMKIRQFFVNKSGLDDFVHNCKFSVVYG